MNVKDSIDQVEKELNQVRYIKSHVMSRMWGSRVQDVVFESGLPYVLEMSRFDFSGTFHHNYLYWWTDKNWSSSSSLWIKETKAGRFQCRSWGEALELLEMVLKDYLRSLKYPVCE